MTRVSRAPASPSFMSPFMLPLCQAGGSWDGRVGAKRQIRPPPSRSLKAQGAIPPQKNAYWSGTRRASFARMGNLPPDAGERKRSRIKQGGISPFPAVPAFPAPLMLPDKLLGPLLDGIGSAGHMGMACGQRMRGTRRAPALGVFSLRRSLMSFSSWDIFLGLSLLGYFS